MADMMNFKVTYPYTQALIVMSSVCVFFAVVAAVISGLAVAEVFNAVWALLALMNLAFWVLMLVIGWVMGLFTLSQIRDFLGSKRPLIRWRYTPDEWATITEARWQEEKELQMLAPILLALMFGLIGVIVNGGMGLLIGAAFGGGLGATLMVGNDLAQHWERQSDRQVWVALGVQEILYDGAYFRGDAFDPQSDLSRNTASALD